jgi:DNA-binding CsgD family transcriptional regulator
LLVVLTARPRQLAALGEPWRRFLYSGVTRVRLDGLSAADIQRYAQALGIPVAPRVAAAIRRDTAGNPLHCRLMLDELSPAVRGGAGGDLPTPASVDQLVRHRLTELSAAARDLVEIAAVLGRRSPLTALTAIADSSARHELVASYLVEVHADEVEFSHPLVHRAVEATLCPERKRELHMRAGALPGPIGLKHRAAAAGGPDAELADELERAGLPAQAAELTADPVVRRRRRLDALESLVDAGEAAAAGPLGRLVAADGDLDSRAEALLGQLDVLTGRLPNAVRRLNSAWSQRDAADVPAAVATGAAYLANLLALNGDVEPAALWAERAVATGGPKHAFAGAMTAIVLAMTGDLESAAAAIGGAAGDGLAIRGLISTLAEDFPSAIGDLSVCWSRIRSGEPTRLPSQALSFLADAEFRAGHWTEAATHAELAVSLAHDADRVWDYPFVHGYATLVAAGRGDTATARSHAEAAWSAATAVGVAGALITAGAAMAVAAAARGDHDAVFTAAEQLRATDGLVALDRIGLWEWRCAEAESLLANGRRRDAGRALDELVALTADSCSATRLTEAWRLRARLGDAARCFAEARKVAPRATVYARALLDLDEGLHLADRDRGRSAALLTSAAGVLRRLGAEPALARIPGRAAPVAGLRLTPAQAAVARLVATGRSNREVAAELVISVKTVEHHLSQIYTAAGVRSRTELTARLLGAAGG